MSLALKTPSGKSALQLNGSDMHVSEGFITALTRGFEKVWKRDFESPKQGMQFFREEKTRFETQTFHTFRGISGNVPANRDADEIPFVTRGEGFGFDLQTHNFRQGIKIEQTMVEVDNVGITRGLQADLTNAAKNTVEHSLADIFNRGVDASSTPLLADDGLCLIDSARPNANPAAGTWSNLETASAITPDAIFQAQLNARATRGEDGELYPRMIKAIICRPQDSKVLWEIRNSNYRPTDAMNVNNYFKEYKDATFDIVTYDYMTTANVYYVLSNPKSDENELMFFWRIPPSLKTWVGDNPDIINQRIRFSFGTALGSPRKAWRGGAVL